MAKSNNTLLYTGLGLAALVLLKKRDNSEISGIGASKKVYVLTTTERYIYSHGFASVHVRGVCRTLDKAIELAEAYARIYKNDNNAFTGVITNRDRLDSFDVDPDILAYAELYYPKDDAHVMRFYITEEEII